MKQRTEDGGRAGRGETGSLMTEAQWFSLGCRPRIEMRITRGAFTRVGQAIWGLSDRRITEECERKDFGGRGTESERSVLFFQHFFAPQLFSNIRCCDNFVAEMRKKNFRVAAGGGGERAFPLLIARIIRSIIRTRNRNTIGASTESCAQTGFRERCNDHRRRAMRREIGRADEPRSRRLRPAGVRN